MTKLKYNLKIRDQICNLPNNLIWAKTVVSMKANEIHTYQFIIFMVTKLLMKIIMKKLLGTSYLFIIIQYITCCYLHIFGHLIRFGFALVWVSTQACSFKPNCAIKSQTKVISSPPLVVEYGPLLCYDSQHMTTIPPIVYLLSSI